MVVDRRQRYLDAMGITRYVMREPSADIPASVAESAVTTAASAPKQSAAAVSSDQSSAWEMLKARVASCTACELHTSRTQTVFGAGNTSARLMIVGEAPGAEEDRQGKPFVGRAGQLLNAMLHAIGLARQAVYIANILKCRPPGNRNPSPEEVAACRPFLQQQLSLIKPKVMLAVGGVAAHNLLDTDEAVGRLRNRVHYYGEDHIPLLVTYHPAYLLRRPEEKAKVWQDLQKLYGMLCED
ncbi:MAG TPA: uracil-DNA glycosylase [Thiolapillus brandeum]|uniref:Type-4 uracil-DNA glycosylase n=1 Tax=Thiolapillus brandeum TaxID=1076588 RepID=A0A831KAQ6_9GAMM|nr:uracil-DNA glycosylase [Thiolapillus brandeum]